MPISNNISTNATPVTGLGNGRALSPRRIVIHYTAGSTLSGAVNALRSAGFSYNVLIDVDGSLHQARPYNRTAGHAGRSNWKETGGLTNGTTLNDDAIGISLVNLGLHDFFREGRYWHGFRNGQVQPPSVADQDANKLSSIYAPKRLSHWAPYDPRQVAACETLVGELIAAYPGIEEIVGHDDIAIDYKFDPGPDFDLQGLRRQFGKEGPLGFAAKVNSPDGTLNVRDRAFHMDGRVTETLHQNDDVHIRSVTYASARSSAALVRPSSGRALTAWASVDIDGSNTHAGFVHMRYLTATPLHASYIAQL